ncbi:RagB/SusD family nutrient uptake outer membrane protein [Daejeonella sp.]|uniref:RagB/SusD family nutrient uptake outer membrane protein n=1 Tax=Daejeonella sp. TaxID=2805397 RepID=UPI003982FDF5
MKKIFIFSAAILTLVLGSCKDDWFTIQPKGEANFETLLNKSGVNFLLIGAYSNVDGANNRSAQTQAWSTTVSNWVWGSVRADDAYKGSNSGDQALINDIAGHFLTADNTYVNSNWQQKYDGVLRCNDVLKAVAKATDMSALETTQAIAQARFLRAHFYTELTNLYGKIPYISETTENPSTVPNDRLLWPEIEADLKFAQDNLPHRWSDKGRATKWAAKTYLARVYLAQRKYADAKPLLEDVYTNGGFTLAPQFINNFLIATVNNSESIFEVQYSVNDGFGANNANIGDALNSPSFKSSSNFFQPSHSLVSAYRTGNDGLPVNLDPTTYIAAEQLPYSTATSNATVLYTQPVDMRLDWTLSRPGVPDFDWGIPNITWIRDLNNGGPYMSKKSTYLQSEKNIYSSTTVRPGANANNYRKFKLSHVILWLAECEAEVGSLATATKLVNEIRNRAKNSTVVKFSNGTPAANYKTEPYPVNFASKAFALLAIRHEERLEFALEGVRFFDLVRWGIAGPVLNQYLAVDGLRMPSISGKKFQIGQNEIVPIPLTQIDLSKDKNGKSALTQNPGY